MESADIGQVTSAYGHLVAFHKTIKRQGNFDVSLYTHESIASVISRTQNILDMALAVICNESSKRAAACRIDSLTVACFELVKAIDR